MPLVEEFVGEVGGTKMKERYRQGMAEAVGVPWHEMSQEQRNYEFVTAPGWWFESSSTLGQGDDYHPQAPTREDGRDRD